MLYSKLLSLYCNGHLIVLTKHDVLKTCCCKFQAFSYITAHIFHHHKHSNKKTFICLFPGVYPFLIHYILRLTRQLNDKSFISIFLTPILQNNKKFHCSILDLVGCIDIYLNSHRLETDILH